MLPYLRIGSFLLQTSGLAILFGVWLGTFLVEKEARRLQLKSDQVYNLVFYGLVSGLVGARLAYALRYVSAYVENPLSLFALNPNTLSAVDGLLVGLLIAWVYGWRKGLPFRRTLDALAPGFAAFMVFWGVSHFLSGDAFGSPARLPWSIFLWNEYRHPAQIYEILAAVVIFLVVWRRPLGEYGRGFNFLLFVSLSAGARLFLEAFRGDSVIWPGGLRAAQLISIAVLLAALWIMRSWYLSATES